MINITKRFRSALLVTLAVASVLALGYTQRGQEPQQYATYGSRASIDGQRADGCVQFGRNFRGLRADFYRHGQKREFESYEVNGEYRELNLLVIRFWWLTERANARGSGLRLFFGTVALGQFDIRGRKERLRIQFSGSVADECID